MNVLHICTTTVELVYRLDLHCSVGLLAAGPNIFSKYLPKANHNNCQNFTKSQHQYDLCPGENLKEMKKIIEFQCHDTLSYYHF